MVDVSPDYRPAVQIDRYAAAIREQSLDAMQGSGRQQPRFADDGYIALIDRRTLERECLAHGLSDHHISRKVLTFSNLQHLREVEKDLGAPAAVLFNAGNVNINDRQLAVEITELVEAVAPTAVIVLSESQDLNAVLDIIALGVRGYIPSSVSIDVCIQAIGLAIAGGKFVPASSVLNMREYLGFGAPQKVAPTISKFTNRQSAVAEALRCGKANKVIASELNLCESTIKVHIRNIMKKLGATNRTEVAYKIGDMVTGG